MWIWAPLDLSRHTLLQAHLRSRGGSVNIRLTALTLHVLHVLPCYISSDILSRNAPWAQQIGDCFALIRIIMGYIGIGSLMPTNYTERAGDHTRVRECVHVNFPKHCSKPPTPTYFLPFYFTTSILSVVRLQTQQKISYINRHRNVKHCDGNTNQGLCETRGAWGSHFCHGPNSQTQTPAAPGSEAPPLVTAGPHTETQTHRVSGATVI